MLQYLHQEFDIDAAPSGMNRYLRAIDYFGECISRLCLLAVAAYRENGLPDPRTNRALQKLAQPSLGDWNNLFNLVLKWYRRQRGISVQSIVHADLLKSLHEIANTRLEDPEFVEQCQLLMRELVGTETGAVAMPFRSLADATIRLRNRVAHGGLPEEEWLNRMASAVGRALDIWSRELPLLANYSLEVLPEPVPTDAGPVQLVSLVSGGNSLFDFDCLLIARDGDFYHLHGNDRKQQVRYLNHIRGRVLDDTDSLLKKQISFFSRLTGQEIKESELGSQFATSLPELSKILREYKYEPDKILGGDFQLIEEIGRGGMGIVYRALQISRDRLCAVKVLPKGIVVGDVIFQRFQREAQTLEALDHRNIVEFIEFGETEHDAYLAMELIDGVTLDEVFSRLRQIVDRRPDENDLLDILGHDDLTAGFSIDRAHRPYYHKIVEWIGQAASALEHIHELGIFHRDLKHANIMIERGSGRAVVLDFGLAKNQEMSMTLEGQFLGTLRFSSPEQLRGTRHSYDERSDIYSLGLILYELLALRTSFLGETFEQLNHQILFTDPMALREVNPGLPADLVTIAHKCIDKNPTRRYASGGELYEDLKNWSEHRPVNARPPTPAQRALKWSARNPVLSAALGVVAGSTIVIFSIVSFFFLRLIEENVVSRKAIVEARGENAQSLFAIGSEFDAAISALQAGRVARELGSDLDSNGRQITRGALYRVHYQRTQAGWFQDLFNTVLDIRFSPDGKYLAAANEEFKTINIFQLSDGTEIQKLAGHTGAVNAVAFGSEGKLASAGSGGVIRLWRFAEGKDLGELKGHRGGVDQVSFDPGSGELVSGGGGEIIFWDLERRVPRRTVQAHKGAIRGLLHTNRDTVISGGVDGMIQLWDREGRRLRQLATGSPVRAIAYDPGARIIASGHEDGRVRLWNLEDNRRQEFPVESAALTDLAFSPGGKHVLISSASQTILLWRVADGTVQGRLKGHIGLVNTVDFSPLGDIAASADEGGSIRLWRYRESDMVTTTQEHVNAAYKVKYSPDGRFFASSGDDGLIKVWPTPGEGPGRVLDRIPGHKIMDFDFVPKGDLLVAGTWSLTGPPKLRVYDVVSGRMLHDLKGHRGMVYSLGCSAKNNMIAAGDFISSKPLLKIWDSRSGKELRSLAGHENSIVALRFTPDATGLVSSALDKTIKIWDPATGAERKSIDLPISMASLGVSPKGTFFAGGGYDGSLEIRRWPGGELLHRIQAHSRILVDMEFSPDGKYLMTVGFDRTLKVWDPGPEEPELLLNLHFEENPWSVTFPPGQEERMLTSDAAGRLQHWELNMDLDDLMKRACSPAVRNYLRNNLNLNPEQKSLCDE